MLVHFHVPPGQEIERCPGPPEAGAEVGPHTMPTFLLGTGVVSIGTRFLPASACSRCHADSLLESMLCRLGGQCDLWRLDDSRGVDDPASGLDTRLVRRVALPVATSGVRDPAALNVHRAS